MDSADKFMTVDELAQYLGFERQTIYNKIHNNQIPFHKIGLKAVRFKKAEIDAWIEKQKERERNYLIRGGRYYIALKTPPRDYDITSEDEFINETVEEIKSSWKIGRLPFEFEKEDLKIMKEIMRQKLVYPRVIKNNIPVYELGESRSLRNYLTILKTFKGTLDLGVDFILQLKERLLENIRKDFQMADPDMKEMQDEPCYGFLIEDIVEELLEKLTEIIIYLEFGKKDINKKYVIYANRYLSKETFLTLYISGFCYFIRSPFSYDPPNYLVKDKTIDELTPEQIKEGLKGKIFTEGEIKEGVTKRIKRLEAEVKALKSIVKNPVKGGKQKNGKND